MFCTQCGSALAADAKFCMQCGAAVVAPQAHAAPQPQIAAAHAKAKPFSAEWFKETQKYGKLAVPRYVVLIVSIIVIIFGLMSMVNGVNEMREGMGYQQSGYKP